MKFLILTDIEGVTGVTTYEQAEGTQFGKDMLMNDLSAVLETINKDGQHEIIIYDEHMDGRNVDLSCIPPNVSVVCGKPIETDIWASESPIDGLIMVGFHSMAGTPDALLPHSYYREHQRIYIDDMVVGEIGMEAALAGVYDVPLILVTGDSAAQEETLSVIPTAEAAVVKKGYGYNEARCYSTALTKQLITKAASRSLDKLKSGVCTIMKTASPVTLTVEIEPSEYLELLKKTDSTLFADEKTFKIQADNIARAWEKLLKLQKEALK
jgi:D-amino peptidase